MITVPMRTIEDTTPDEQKDLAPRRTHDRDDDQKTLDTWTKELVTAWDEAGRPGEDSYAGPAKRFATDDGPDAKRRVARAMALVNHDRKDGTPKVAALWFKNSKPDKDGFITVKYGVRAVPVKEAAKADADAEKTGSEQPSQKQPSQEQPPFEGEQEANQPSPDDESTRGFRRSRR